MNKVSTALLVGSLLLAACGYAALADGSEVNAAAGRKLNAAVATFNKAARQRENGAKEPPLTEAEVIAAISAWDGDHYKIDEEMKAIYEKIAVEKTLPDGAVLDAMSQFDMNGYRFSVRNVVLEVRSGDKGYRFPIRSRMLGSEPSDTNLIERRQFIKATQPADGYPPM